MTDLHADLVRVVELLDSDECDFCDGTGKEYGRPCTGCDRAGYFHTPRILKEVASLLRTHRDELLGVVEGWRPIEELRSAAVVVLFHIPGKSLPVMTRADDYNSGFAHWLEGATHWRPLPAPLAIDAARHGRIPADGGHHEA